MNDMRRTFGSREVRLYEMSCRFFSRAGPCCYDDRRTALLKPARDGLARALRAAGDQDAFASEFTREVRICTRCSHGFLLDLWTVLTVGLVDFVATSFAAPESSPNVTVPKPLRAPGD